MSLSQKWTEVLLCERFMATSIFKLTMLTQFNKESTLVIVQEIVNTIEKNIKDLEALKPESSESRNKYKKMKNTIVHHFKNMLFGKILYHYSLCVFKNEENIQVLQKDIVDLLKNLKSDVGFQIEDRDLDYLNEKMNFLIENKI